MTIEERTETKVEHAETIEERLKHLILARYKSVLAFSEAAGLPHQTVVSILKRGLVNSGLGNIFKICSCLGISADGLGAGEIIFYENSAEVITPEERELLRQYRALKKDGQRRILRNLKGEYDDALASLPEESTNATGAV